MVCLALSVLACQGRGNHCETFACTKNSSLFIPLFIFSWSKATVSHVIAVMGFLGGD